MPMSDDYRAVWVQSLLDWGHVPLFAAMTAALWRWGAWPKWAAVAMAVAAAVFSERAQAWTGRTVELSDLLRSLAGILLALVWLAGGGASWRGLRLVASAAILAASLVQVGPVMADAAVAWYQFPTVGGFNSRWSTTRWNCEGGRLRRVQTESATWAGQIESPDGSRCALVLAPPVADWSGYATVCCEFSFAGPPLSILASVRDGRYVEPPGKRFDFRSCYQPGHHTICFDLRRLAKGDEFAPLDMTQIQSFHFVVRGMARDQRVLVHRVYLTRQPIAGHSEHVAN
jgi:hypothetical protein